METKGHWVNLKVTLDYILYIGFIASRSTFALTINQFLGKPIIQDQALTKTLFTDRSATPSLVDTMPSEVPQICWYVALLCEVFFCVFRAVRDSPYRSAFQFLWKIWKHEDQSSKWVKLLLFVKCSGERGQRSVLCSKVERINPVNIYLWTQVRQETAQFPHCF